MGFSNLIGLAALIFVPLIIVLYMLRPKHKPKKIPSLYLWQSVMDEIESASRLHKLRNSILMILQILAVILLALILAGLFMKDESFGNEVIIIVDGSMTMQSTDLEPTRHEHAKGLAKDFVEQLEQGTTMTVISLTDTPDIVISRSTDKRLTIGAIDTLQTSNGYWDAELITETVNGLRQGIEATVVYFGDRSVSGAKNYLTMRDKNNSAVYDLAVTKYPNKGTVSVMARVFNHDSQAKRIPLSLYVDGLFFGAKEAMVETGGTSSLFFEDIPMSVTEIRAVIDADDVLPFDNEAVTTLKAEPIQKVLMVSAGNLFLEKVLKLESGTEMYQVTPEVEMVYEGYDLYIFDETAPEVLPIDGNLLFFNPPEHDEFETLGYVEYPVFETEGHIITSAIDKPEFIAAATQVFEMPNGSTTLAGGSEAIYTTGYGVSAYSYMVGSQRRVVYGFDIHETDLPLSIEFPILMSSTFKYLLQSAMTDVQSIGSGEPVAITLKPSTEKAYVINPSGTQLPLDATKGLQMFVLTDDIGVYEIIQESTDGITTEKFAVNAGQPSDEVISTTGTGEASTYQTARSLKVWLGIVLVLILCLEWLIYSSRRKKKWA